MHNGDDTNYYLSEGYKVIAIEASPDLVDQAKHRFQEEINQGRLELLNVGVAEDSGEMDFYLNKKSSVWNSFDPSIGGRENSDFQVIRVETAPMNHIVRDNGLPYYMKIDIEGNDIVCLDSLKKSDLKPRFISAEVNYSDVIFRLKEMGYTKFKLIDQFSLLPLELPMLKAYKRFKLNKSFRLSMNFLVRVVRKLCGNFISKLLLSSRNKLLKYDHPFGSSGTFGEGLPGEWQSFDEVMSLYYTYYFRHKGSKNDVGYNFWVDIHATY